MTEIGDIYYVKKGVVSDAYYGLPVIISGYEENCYVVRHQEIGELIHGTWRLSEADIKYYLEQR